MIITGSVHAVLGEVAVYDSRFTGGDLSSSLTHELASIYRPLVIREEDGEVDPHLVVYVPPVEQQIGKDDCEAFAIAFAVHLLLGEKLTKPNEATSSDLFK